MSETREHTHEPLDTASLRGRANGGMDSACGEYNCPCHYDLPKCADKIDSLRAKAAAMRTACEAAVEVIETMSGNDLALGKDEPALSLLRAALALNREDEP